MILSYFQRCMIIEGILRRSNYNQFQFLSTSLQPMLHRDFMYTAQSQFPAIEFVPVSTHTSRKLKVLSFTLIYLLHLQKAHTDESFDAHKLETEVTFTVLQIRRGNRENPGIISLIFAYKHAL